MAEPVMVNFVCWGNICRSPAAMMVMNELVSSAGLTDQIIVDSSGTGNWHLGQPANSSTVREAQRRGYQTEHKAKQFKPSDFLVYDYIVALDSDRAEDLKVMATADSERSKISLLRSYDPGADDLDVPDPYGYGEDMFKLVFDMIEPACEGLLKHIREEHAI